METKEKSKMNGHSAACDCNYCQSNSIWHFGQNHHGIFVIRMLLGLIIMLLVFWIGLQVGEFKGYVEGNMGFGLRSQKTMLYNGNGMWGYGGASAGGSTQQAPITQTNPLPAPAKLLNK